MKYSILSSWYATPLNHNQATDLIKQATVRRLRAVKGGRESHVSFFMEGIASFWLDDALPPKFEYPNPILHHSIHGRALLFTIVGQLLISRQMEGALSYLNESFKLATPLLKAEDYFLLMERYKAFESIPLFESPKSGKTLDELLNLGGVIKKLRHGITNEIKHNPTDIYG